MTRFESDSPGPHFGLWQSLAHPAVSRYLSRMGWEFVVLDLQHGPMSSETAYECIHTLRAGGTDPWVRVAIDQPAQIQRALDLGAAAVVVPMVNSVEQARKMVQAAKYPPLGDRSIGGDFEYLLDRRYPELANRQTRLLVQVEHIQAVRVVDDLMSVPGVDGCFIGPTDLAVSMGLPWQGFADDAGLRALLQQSLAAVRKHGKIACCNTYSASDAAKRLEEGYDWITYQSDVDLMMRAGRRLIEELENLRNLRRPVE